MIGITTAFLLTIRSCPKFCKYLQVTISETRSKPAYNEDDNVESLEPGTLEVGRTEANQEEVHCKAMIRKNVTPEVVDL